jgi:ABC-2 type transport system permease protein
MKSLSVLKKTLRDLRWQVFWYGLGQALMAALVIYIFPSYREQFADFEIPEALRGFIGEADYTSPEGFVSAEFYSFIPLLGVIFAIMAGTSALAGEEAGGTLDLLLSQPISRRALALQKIAGFALSALLITGITYIGWLVSVPFVDIEISYLDLLSATLRLIPITLAFGFIAMWLAAVLPDRRQATGLVTAFAVVSYFLSYLATIVEAMAPLRWGSLFFYHDGTNALNAPDPAKLAVIFVTIVAFAALTLFAFEKREIGVIAGGLKLPWQRARPAGLKEATQP